MKTGYHKRGRCARDISGPGTGGFPLSEKTWKNSKKGVDKNGREWYSIKTVRETAVATTKYLGWENKTTWKVRKKFLTRETRCGNLYESPARAARNKGAACRAGWELKKSFEKLEKSSWQSWNGVVKWTPAAAKRCAPCKLNNVTNTKHQIWIWLFEQA